MPIAINGSGTITGISVGGIPDGVVDTDVLAANAVTYAKIGTTEQGQLCKAWVNFDGTGTVAIRAQYNVSSITDNGTGNYTVNLATAITDGNHSTNVTASDTGHWGTVCIVDSFTASSVRMSLTINNGTALADASTVCVAIFR